MPLTGTCLTMLVRLVLAVLNPIAYVLIIPSPRSILILQDSPTA